MPSILEMATHAVDQLPLRFFECAVEVEILFIVTPDGYAVQILEDIK